MSSQDKTTDWQPSTTTRIFVGNPDYDVMEITADLVGVRKEALQVKESDSSIVLIVGKETEESEQFIYKEFEIPERIDGHTAIADYNCGLLRICCRVEKGTWEVDQPGVSSLKLNVDWDDRQDCSFVFS